MANQLPKAALNALAAAWPVREAARLAAALQASTEALGALHLSLSDWPVDHE